MNLLSHLRLRTKLTLMVVLSVMALIVAIGIAASVMRQRLTEDRIDKLHAIVDNALGLAQSLEDQVAAHQLTHAQAVERLRSAVHTMRFDEGEGYVFAQTPDGMVLAHGANPKLEDALSPAKDAAGQSLTSLIADALRASDRGFIAYSYPRPGQTVALPKIAYVARFAPWNQVFGAGAYVDDLETAFQKLLWKLSLSSGSVVVVILLVAWLIDRDITRSLGSLMAAMGRLSKGELDVAIPGGERQDEVGAMSREVVVFREGLQTAERLTREQQTERRQAEADRRAALVGMAETIEGATGSALQEIGVRTSTMQTIAGEMNASAARTKGSAEVAAIAAGQALANAQTVASAAEQLSTSIREIGGQVSESAAVVSRAVEASGETRKTIETLNVQVGRIGAVTDMIGEIAAKTNLLALNATIEAARAGDAGKGFAVVASEVKALATQTARSTQEIDQHIAEVRAATDASVASVGRIEETISEVNAIAGSIAAAVEQQGAATAEIARNVTQTASAANEMTSRVTEVSAEAEDTGQRANDVRDNAGALTAAMEDLRRAIIRVVRTSATEVDRRGSARYDVDLPCRVSVSGQAAAPALVKDISCGGAKLLGGPPLTPGARGRLELDGVGFALPFVVCHAESDVLNVGFALDEAMQRDFAPVPERLGRQRAA